MLSCLPPTCSTPADVIGRQINARLFNLTSSEQRKDGTLRLDIRLDAKQRGHK
jgi:hypothetical protein